MLLKANPEDWLWLIVSILTAWRLTTLICYEAGPFNVMSGIRLLLYKIRLGSLIDCFHCAAVWISLFVAAGLYRISISTLFLALATAAGASVIEKILLNGSHLNQKTNYDNH